MIYINGRFLTQRLTGVQRFAYELCVQINTEVAVVLLVPIKCQIKSDYDVSMFQINRVGDHEGQIWEQLDLPKVLKKMGMPLLINFCNTAPIFYKNKISTVHDLSFLSHEKWHSWKFRTLYKFIIPRVIKSSKYIFTVSNVVKAELLYEYDIEQNMVEVIYNGYPSSKNSSKDSLQQLQSAKPYFLFVGSLDPRKNLQRLIQAFLAVEQDDYILKIVGSVSDIFANANIDTQNLNKIEFLGRVDDQELHQLYTSAYSFIYPSLYEGFGIPPLEALSFGCPILISNIPVFKEIYKEYAIYFDPLNIGSIARAISHACKNQEVLADNVKRSRVLVEQFSWYKSGQQVLGAVNKLENVR